MNEFHKNNEKLAFLKNNKTDNNTSFFKKEEEEPNFGEN
jgi:hypothetical protein